jgi:hypothetical protein
MTSVTVRLPSEAANGASNTALALAKPTHALIEREFS